MKLLFVLPGLHRINRGAEIAFMAIAGELSTRGHSVTLMGSGPHIEESHYEFIHAGCISREHFERAPNLPILRNDCAYEELTFIPGLLRHYKPHSFDATITCSYPFVNWVLRARKSRGQRPAHIFVTENGDWPAFADNSEFRFFSCDGLVCTNPIYYERNKDRWHCDLIPNGVFPERFRAGRKNRQKFGLSTTRKIVLMVSALIKTKRIELAIEAMQSVEEAYLVVAGDGPERNSLDGIAREKLPGRFTRLTVPFNEMPDLYSSADAFLHLSEEEAFGNVYLEAMATSLPIVAPDTPHVRWLVGTENSLFQDDSPTCIAQCIRIALNDVAFDREKQYRRVDTFDWQKIALKYEKFVAQIVEKKQEIE